MTVIEGVIDTPVLIVGAGPVGLALTIDLGWRGVACTLIEQGAPEDRLTHPRMDNVGIRTMEIARRWGLVEAIENAGFPRDLPMSIVYTTAVLGPELDREVRADKLTGPRPAFSPSMHEICPQNFFDPVLQKAAAAYPGNRLLYRHRLVALSQSDGGVEAQVECLDDGATLTIRAQYLVACDGAGGLTAGMLGLNPQASKVLAFSTNIFINCPALAERTAGRRAYRYILMGPEGVWGSMVNIDGRDGWRLQVLGDDVWRAWTDDDAHALIRRCIGGDLAYELLSVVPWARRELVVDQYRAGRCFLAGDAGHQFSPTGGYGMNTGVAEAMDLSWKLAAVLAGWGGDALLASYDLERRPVASRNARQASENFAAMRSPPPEPRLLEPGAAGDAIRAAVGAQLREAMAREWNSFGIHLGAIYRHSPIIATDEASGPAPDVARFVQSAQPGARAPHVWLSPGRSTLDLFGNGFVLLEFGDEPVKTGAEAGLMAAAAAQQVPIAHHRIADQAARALYEKRFVLVRPDGHVAWRSDTIPGDAQQLIARVRGATSAAVDQSATGTGNRPLATSETIMTASTPSPDQLRSLKAATAGVPGPWISEIVMQTNQYEIMKTWYEAILGGTWIAETNPNGAPPAGERPGVGGKQVFASDIRASFMRLPMPHPYAMTFALFELTHLAHAPGRDPGINHMQLKFPDLDALVARLELMRDHGLDPHRCANHGAITSFYFRDPDENIVELCVDNFATAEERIAYMKSPAFQQNPSGISLVRDDFIAAFRRGVSRAELLAV